MTLNIITIFALLLILLITNMVFLCFDKSQINNINLMLFTFIIVHIGIIQKGNRLKKVFFIYLFIFFFKKKIL